MWIYHELPRLEKIHLSLFFQRVYNWPKYVEKRSERSQENGRKLETGPIIEIIVCIRGFSSYSTSQLPLPQVDAVGNNQLVVDKMVLNCLFCSFV